MKTKLGLLLVMLSLAVWCDDSTDAEQPTDPKVDYKQPPSENQPESTVTDWTNRRLNRAVAAATKAQQRSDARSQWLLDNPKNPDPYKQRPATGEPEPKSAQATVNSLPRSLQRGLVAYYPFNGNAKDESGNGHDGKVKGAVLAQESKEATHAGYLFVEGHIDLPNALAQQFEGNSPISVSMWVRSSPNLTEGNRSMFAIGVEAHNRAFVMVMVKGRFLYSQWVDGDVRTDYVISDRKWYHCVATYDGSSCSLYADGQLLTQKKVDANRATESIMIGKSFVGQKELWKDQIDDVRIYNRALSEAEVKSLYKYESKPPVKTGNNLLRKLAHFLRP